MTDVLNSNCIPGTQLIPHIDDSNMFQGQHGPMDSQELGGWTIISKDAAQNIKNKSSQTLGRLTKAQADAMEAYIDHQAKTNAVDYNHRDTIRRERIVTKCVDHLLTWIGGQDSRFKGMTRKGIGSFYGKVKLNPVNEFDFLCEITSLLETCINLCQVKVEARSFKTKHLPKSFLKLSFKDGDIPLTWQGTQCTDGACDHAMNILSPRCIHADFQNLVQKYLELFAHDGAYIESNGPAVSFFIRDLTETGTNNRNLSPYMIKVDLTVAIPFTMPQNTNQSWPLAHREDLDIEIHDVTEMCRRVASYKKNETELLPTDSQFTHHCKIIYLYLMKILKSQTTPELLGIPVCHCVPAGDMWRLSFAEFETNLVASTPYEENKVLIALKKLRDEVVVTDPFEESSLSSYPLQVGCLAAFGRDRESNRKEARTLGFGIAPYIFFTVLSAVQDHSLSSLIVKDEVVFQENDTSYLEAKRMLYNLKQNLTETSRKKTLVLLFTMGPVLLGTALLFLSWFMLFECLHATKPEYLDNMARLRLQLLIVDIALLYSVQQQPLYSQDMVMICFVLFYAVLLKPYQIYLSASRLNFDRCFNVTGKVTDNVNW